MDMIIKLITDRQYGRDYKPIRLYKEAHERGKNVAKVSRSGGSESVILRIHKENIF